MEIQMIILCQPSGDFVQLAWQATVGLGHEMAACQVARVAQHGRLEQLYAVRTRQGDDRLPAPTRNDGTWVDRCRRGGFGVGRP